jgi:hypothetical protein
VGAPIALGDPEIIPVEALSDKPAGKVPDVTLHVIGGVPVAASVWLYDVPTTPAAKAPIGVEMLGGTLTFTVARLDVTGWFEVELTELTTQ